MQIHEMSLENFRCFADKRFTFAPQFNIMIGDNGVGKTAVLDALAVGISTFLLGIDSYTARGIHQNDVRQMTNLERDIPNNEFVFPVRIHCKGVIGEREVEWGRSLLGNGRRTTQKDAKELTGIAERLQAQVRDQKDVILPLIAYYDTGRLWFHTDIKSQLLLRVRLSGVSPQSNGGSDTVKPGSRLDGYNKCLSPDNNQEFLHHWFRTQELSALQLGAINPTLEGVRIAISCGMERWQCVYHDVPIIAS